MQAELANKETQLTHMEHELAAANERVTASQKSASRASEEKATLEGKLAQSELARQESE
jgi:hypothetical protein